MSDMYINPEGPVRLPMETWNVILRNLDEDNEEVEVTWLDPGDSSEGEWCLHWEDEMFEDGFESEAAALMRLSEIHAGVIELRKKAKCSKCGQNIPKSRAIGLCLPCMIGNVVEDQSHHIELKVLSEVAKCDKHN